MYQIAIEKFTGPFDFLCQLIEEEKLEITEVALAKITDQYLVALAKMPEKTAEELADFLVLAARLLLLKSRALLPVVEEEEPDNLAGQLKLYKEFLVASRKIKAMISDGRFTFSRPASSSRKQIEFSPPPKFKVEELKSAFLHVLRRLDPLVKLPRQLIEKSIQLQQQIQEIRRLLARHKKFDFNHLMEQAQSKTEIIIGFLALLELLKQRQLRVRQIDSFANIMVERV